MTSSRLCYEQNSNYYKGSWISLQLKLLIESVKIFKSTGSPIVTARHKTMQKLFFRLVIIATRKLDLAN